jgi:hypothetical protein
MNLSPVSLIESKPNNRCPDCLWMEIHSEAIQHSSFNPFSKQPSNQIELHLTIQFNEQWCKLLAGRVKFGIKGGELRLKLDNGKIPPDSRDLCGSFNLEVPIKRGRKDAKEDKASFEIGSKGGKCSDDHKETSENVDEFEFIAFQVTTKGSDTEPAWVFEEKQGERVLKCLLKETKLATMSVTAKPCVVRAKFEVSAKDFQLTDAEGLWSNLSPVRRTTVNEFLVRCFLKEKIQPYLSEQELRYE